MSEKTVHVAAENARYRASLKETLLALDIGDVIETSPEGAEGVIAVRDTSPDILIVCTDETEDTVEHMMWYREAAPAAYIVGFAFTEEEARDLKRAGVDRVVMSDTPHGDLIGVLHQTA